jgi:hypothetical protein
MSSHEHFRELSALAAIGQLSSEEDRQLSQHLGECSQCRDARDDYAHVIQHQLPLAEAARSRLRSDLRCPLPDAEIRDRFLARARADGVDFSPEAQRGRPVDSPGVRWAFVWRPALAIAAVAAFAVLATSVARRYQLVPRSQVMSNQRNELLGENERLRAQLSAVRRDIERGASDLGKLRQAKVTSEESLKQLEKRLEESRGQTDQLTAQSEELEGKEKRLASDSQQKDGVIADLSAKNEKLHRDNADYLSERIILESQVRDLTASLQQQTADVERERQLMTVSKDVRQLISARNLHILDVHDVDGGGRSAKAFGRVFYAEGQALIFYAFDLSSGKLTPAKYNFQAWGQREYAAGSIRSLGTFEVDDHEQRRWVLKVTDPALLRGIDSVFVTAEALGDAKGPHGRKLLYAYMVGQPNHP